VTPRPQHTPTPRTGQPTSEQQTFDRGRVGIYHQHWVHSKHQVTALLLAKAWEGRRACTGHGHALDANSRANQESHIVELSDADPPTRGQPRCRSTLGGFGTLRVVGVEGTGAYGAGLARYLMAQGQAVVEVDRPDRKARRAAGKSDPIDAESAARAALNRVRTGLPKQRDGMVEALRNLRVARRSAVSQRADCVRQIKTLIITAPQELRERLRDLNDTQLLRLCAGFRPNLCLVGEPEQAAKVALRALGHRHAALSEEIADLEALIAPLVEQINPALLGLNGVGPDSAGQRLITAGQNTERLQSEGAFAMLCGVAPIPASSGKTNRHRLNRGGDRQANAALYRVVLTGELQNQRWR